MSNEITVYKTRRGETLADIARANNVSLTSLLRYNPTLKNGELPAGTQVFVFTGHVNTPEKAEAGENKPKEESNPPKEESESAKETKQETKAYTPQYRAISRLSNEELLNLARRATENEYLEKRQKQAAGYREDKAELLADRRDAEADYRSRARELGEETQNENEGAMQAAVRQNIAHSSILNELKEEIAKRAREGQLELLHEQQGVLGKLDGALRLLEQENQEKNALYTAQENNERAARYEKEKAKMEKQAQADAAYNEAEAKKAAESPERLAKEQQQADAARGLKQLLQSLPKKNARQYVTGNEQALRNQWGSFYNELKNMVQKK